MAEFRYRNNNTGHVVEYDHREPRLEMLPNWERLDDAASEKPKDPPVKRQAARHSRED